MVDSYVAKFHQDISVNNNCIKKINNDYNWRSCYGNLKVNLDNNNNSGIINVQWTVKINQTKNKDIILGIASDMNGINGGSYAQTSGWMYYAAGGQKYHSGSCVQYGEISTIGDEITIELNVETKSLSFKKNNNNKNFGIAYDNLPDGIYRLAIDLIHLNDEVTIIKQNIEYKNRYSKTIKEIINNLDNLNTWMNNEMKELNGLSFDNLINKKKEIELFENDSKMLDATIQKMNENIKEYKKILNKNMTPDIKQYKLWNNKDIIKWICTLDNGIYIKYTDLLYKSFEEEEMKINYLNRLTTNDLTRFGIKSFQHKIDLLDHIHRLFNQDDNLQEQEEGDQSKQKEKIHDID